MSELGISRAAVWGSSGGEEPERARAEFRAQSAIHPSPSEAHRTGGCNDGETAQSRMPRTAGNGPSTSPWASAMCCTLVTREHLTTTGSGRTTAQFYYPWQFDLADIQAPVSLWHGLKDFIPITHARWLADRIPNITTHFPPEEDHTNIEENNRAAAFAWLKVSV